MKNLLVILLLITTASGAWCQSKAQKFIAYKVVHEIANSATYDFQVIKRETNVRIPVTILGYILLIEDDPAINIRFIPKSMSESKNEYEKAIHYGGKIIETNELVLTSISYRYQTNETVIQIRYQREKYDYTRTYYIVVPKQKK